MIDAKKFLLAACLALTGCAGPKKPVAPTTPVATSTGKEAPASLPAPSKGTAGMSFLKHMILSLAQREWEYFGRQIVLFDGEEESMPHVGHWEDDEEAYSVRVNWYWRAAGKPRLNGNDCHQPWSAAFMSWIMRESGVPEYQFPTADAHRDYLLPILNREREPDAGFVAHGIAEYSPQPGDLICATRGHPGESLDGLNPRLVLMDHNKLHCDIVVERKGDVLAVIGGNVRNSVSKTVLRLDGNGLVQPTRRRPWFLVLENRL